MRGDAAGRPPPVAVLTLNPAVDMTYEIDRLLPDRKVHARATRYDPGGNGINVARALKRLQVPAHTFCVLAGETGGFLERLLRGRIDTLTFERVAGETRINGTAVERDTGNQYEISGVGPAVPEATLERLQESFVATTGSGFGVLTGTLQPGLPPDLYASLTRRIRAQGGRPVVDTHGRSLRAAVAAHPFLIKPNRYELAELAGRALDDVAAVAAEAQRLQRGGIDLVCVSLGGDGALLAAGPKTYYATAPSVRVDSTVGAGDSMLAGLVCALARGDRFDNALRLAVACGAGTVGRPGTELFSPGDLTELMARVSVRTLES